MVLPPPARGAGTLIPSAQRFVWAAKQPLGNAALGHTDPTILLPSLGANPGGKKAPEAFPVSLPT